MYLLIFLATLWVVLSGYFSTLPLLPGIISLFLVLLLFYKAKKSSDYSYKFSLRFSSFVAYIFYMLKEIYKSNVSVAKLILFSKASPEVVFMPNDFIENSAVNTFANSVNLTPGSITLQTNKNFIIIHCINLDVSIDIKNGDMKNKVSQLQQNLVKNY